MGEIWDHLVTRRAAVAACVHHRHGLRHGVGDLVLQKALLVGLGVVHGPLELHGVHGDRYLVVLRSMQAE